ncbi:glycerophosphodiester phosphodiesterase [Candidatus Bipolaricaulota bacterium]
MKVIGHKGAGASASENTASGLKHAMHLGLDAVEIDIWPTADREFVLFHDAHLGRITGHGGWTNSLTSDELSSLPIRPDRNDGVPAERLLLLSEALDLIAGKLDLVLEVKRTRHELERYDWVEERLWQTLTEHCAQDWTLVISFDHRSLYDLRCLAPEAHVGMLYAGEWLRLWDEIESLAPDALLPHWAQTTPELVNAAHRANLEVYPWAVDHRDWMERFVAMGVDGIITDHPEILLEVLQRPQQTPSIEQGSGGTT